MEAGALIALVVFAIAIFWFTDGSWFITIVALFFIASAMGINLTTETVKEGVVNVVEEIAQHEGYTVEAQSRELEDGTHVHVKVERKEEPKLLDVSVLQPENIFTQLRNSERLHSVTMSGELVEACKSEGDCFKGKLRKHDDGTVYACQVEGINCYRLPE